MVVLRLLPLLLHLVLPKLVIKALKIHSTPCRPIKLLELIITVGLVHAVQAIGIEQVLVTVRSVKLVLIGQVHRLQVVAGELVWVVAVRVVARVTRSNKLVFEPLHGTA